MCLCGSDISPLVVRLSGTILSIHDLCAWLWLPFMSISDVRYILNLSLSPRTKNSSRADTYIAKQKLGIDHIPWRGCTGQQRFKCGGAFLRDVRGLFDEDIAAQSWFPRRSDCFLSHADVLTTVGAHKILSIHLLPFQPLNASRSAQNTGRHLNAFHEIHLGHHS